MVSLFMLCILKIDQISYFLLTKPTNCNKYDLKLEFNECSNTNELSVTKWFNPNGEGDNEWIGEKATHLIFLISIRDFVT